MLIEYGKRRNQRGIVLIILYQGDFYNIACFRLEHNNVVQYYYSKRRAGVTYVMTVIGRLGKITKVLTKIVHLYVERTIVHMYIYL